MSTEPSPRSHRVGRLDRLVLAGFLLLLLNAAYLGAFAAPTLSYMGNVLLHLLLGASLLVPFLVVGWRHLRSRGISAPARLGVVLGFFSMLGAGGTGLYLLRHGAIRSNLPIVHLHVGLALAAVAGWAIYLRCRAADDETAGGAEAAPEGFGRAWRATCVALVAALAVYGGIRIVVSNRPDPKDIIRNPGNPPVEMTREAMGGSSGPFFPSSAHTTTGGKIPSNFFMEETSRTCGQSGCHADIYRQWYSSVHHFSSFNNQWYRKSIEYMQEMVGTRPSKWCGGCHDPAVLFNGMMDTPIKEIVNTPEAQAGLGCTACHSIIQVRSSMGQGDYLMQYPPLHDLAVSKNRFVRAFHDYLTKVNPEPHRQTFLKPFHREQPAEFCSACHKVHLDVPVNNYRWFRGFNDYDNWQASGVSGQGARSFYYPPKPSTCVDCHMPLVPSKDRGGPEGLVHSHRVPAANTALPVANQDPEQLKVVTDFLADRKVTVDLFAITESAPLRPSAPRASDRPEALSSLFAVGEEQATGVGTGGPTSPAAPHVYGPLDRIGSVARAGQSVRVEVVVRTRGVGHFFPGGTVDAFDVWTELKAVDAKGRVLLWSGYVGDAGKGPVDPSAHFYRSLMLDANGNPINKRNAWAARATLYVNLIPPGAADAVHYRLDLPPDVASPVQLTAKLNYRKFAWWNTHWAFAGVRDPSQPAYASGKDYDDGKWIFAGDLSGVSGKLKEIPDLPVVTLASDEVSLRVRAPDEPPPPLEVLAVPDDRERWNDYGIGLLLQGDLRGAEAAFLNVTRADPGYADGWLNVARARIAEGNLDGAQEMLDKALRLGPGLARVSFFQGQVHKARGEYDRALDRFRRAHRDYPTDRVVLNEIGRVLFLQERHAEAVQELEKVLAIDPEDLQAHYNLMLAYGALGRKEESERERRFYLRFKANESAQEITGKYRRDHPHDNNERQRIHQHLSHWDAEKPSRPAYSSPAGAP